MMADLKLTRPADRAPVKIAIIICPEFHLARLQLERLRAAGEGICANVKERLHVDSRTYS
jgi:hypothetical protein